MNDRDKAIKILTQARDRLTEQLNERVLESADEIISDAEGETFLSEIEELFDKVGIKLQHVNLMLGQLPKIAEPEPPTKAPAAPEYAAQVTVNSTVAVPTESFQDFGLHIQAGDVQAAGRSLSVLFNIDSAKGLWCAEFFMVAVTRDTSIMTKAMLLRKELIAGNNNNSLMLLYECFGLQPYEAIGIVATLKTLVS